MSTFRIAHLSDPHVLDLTGVGTSRLVTNKRLTGWANLKLNRSSHHKPWVVEAMMEDLRAHRVDHVVVTGDLTNLALEPEFERVRALFDAMGYGPEELSVVPGNHDLYTRGAERTQRFAHFFAPHLTSDLPDIGVEHPSGVFPFVRLRGPVALVGLSTAVARPPLVASGWAGPAQIEALARALEHPEVLARTPVLFAHHPLTNPRGRVASALRGWSDVDALRARLDDVRHALALHGHLHHRVHEVIPTARGAIHRLGATSASLLAHDPRAMAGYNIYTLDERGLVRADARVWSDDARAFLDVALPPALA